MVGLRRGVVCTQSEIIRSNSECRRCESSVSLLGLLAQLLLEVADRLDHLRSEGAVDFAEHAFELRNRLIGLTLRDDKLLRRGLDARHEVGGKRRVLAGSVGGRTHNVDHALQRLASAAIVGDDDAEVAR